MNIEKYRQEFDNFPPTRTDLDDIIASNELSKIDLEEWYGFVRDLYDRREHVEDMDRRSLKEFREQWFYNDECYYEMLKDISEAVLYCEQAITELTDYKEKIFGKFCSKCGSMLQGPERHAHNGHTYKDSNYKPELLYG